MKTSIRAAKEEDAGAIAGILNPIIASGRYTVIGEAVSLEEQIDWIRSATVLGLFNVAVGGGGILGFQSLEPFSRSERALKHVGDVATLAFYTSLGFRIVGTAREHACVSGEYVDEVFTERIL
jgi:L-amino acid N-acyltransferase YncA